MKTRFTVLALFSAVVLTQSGCMCVQVVHTAGSHSRGLQTTGIWTNADGNVMAECSLLDHSEISNKTRNLGTRFVCASAAEWEKAVVAKFDRVMPAETHAYRTTNLTYRISLKPAVTLDTKDSSRIFDGGFVLFPPALGRKHEATPPGVGWARNSTPSFMAAVSNYTINVAISDPSLPHDRRSYRKWWWYPNQLLLVPAFAIDIVTSPIQCILILRSLGGICQHTDNPRPERVISMQPYATAGPDASVSPGQEPSNAIGSGVSALNRPAGKFNSQYSMSLKQTETR